MSWAVDDPGIVLPHLDLQTVIGISISIAGNVLVSFALNLQKLAHLRLDHARENELQDADRESRVSGRDLSARHVAQQDTAARFGAVGHDLERFESQPLIPHRSDSQSPPTTYGLSQYTLPATGDDARSRKSNNGMRPRRHQRKPSFVSRLLPSRLRFRNGSTESLNSRADRRSVVQVEDVFPETNTRTNHRGKGKVVPQNVTEDINEGNYLRSKLWWTGFTLMNVGETGNFISYAFAPASVVAPLGTFALVANCFFAPLILKERFRPRDLLGILLAVIGATTVVLSSPSSDGPAPVLTPDALVEAIAQRPFVIFSIIYLVSVIVLGFLSEGRLGRRVVVIDVGLCALFGGFTVLATKATSTLLTKEWVKMMTEWITYPILAVLVITGIFQIRYLNRALKRFDSKIVIPTQFVLFTLSAIVGSALLYGDFRRASFHEMLTFLYGCGATFAGVFVIASSPNGNSSELVHDEEQHDTGGRREAASRINGVGSLGPYQGTPKVGAREIPGLRHKQSAVSLVGYTPVQNLLLCHTPPRERVPHWER